MCLRLRHLVFYTKQCSLSTLPGHLPSSRVVPYEEFERQNLREGGLLETSRTNPVIFSDDSHSNVSGPASCPVETQHAAGVRNNPVLQHVPCLNRHTTQLPERITAYYKHSAAPGKGRRLRLAHGATQTLRMQLPIFAICLGSKCKSAQTVFKTRCMTRYFSCTRCTPDGGAHSEAGRHTSQAQAC